MDADLEKISTHLATVENLLRKRLGTESHRADTAEKAAKTARAEVADLNEKIAELEKHVAHLRDQRDKAMEENKVLRKSKADPVTA